MNISQAIVAFFLFWSAVGLIAFRSVSKANPHPRPWQQILVTILCGPVLWLIAIITFFEPDDADDTDFPDHGGAA